MEVAYGYGLGEIGYALLRVVVEGFEGAGVFVVDVIGELSDEEVGSAVGEGCVVGDADAGSVEGAVVDADEAKGDDEGDEDRGEELRGEDSLALLPHLRRPQRERERRRVEVFRVKGSLRLVFLFVFFIFVKKKSKKN